MKPLRILVACERSGTVRDAFLALGHDAWSCDIMPSRAPGPHLQCDAREIIGQPWNILIAHPVCKRLANSGVRWLHERPENWTLMRDAADFFLLFQNATHIPKRCVENPIMHGHALKLIGKRASQFIQPWMFGDPFQKSTGLWLTGLPLLAPEKRREDYAPGEIKQECWLMTPGPDREEKRSKTYPGIARAMAETWGNL